MQKNCAAHLVVCILGLLFSASLALGCGGHGNALRLSLLLSLFSLVLLAVLDKLLLDLVEHSLGKGRFVVMGLITKPATFGVCSVSWAMSENFILTGWKPSLF